MSRTSSSSTTSSLSERLRPFSHRYASQDGAGNDEGGGGAPPPRRHEFKSGSTRAWEKDSPSPPTAPSERFRRDGSRGSATASSSSSGSGSSSGGGRLQTDRMSASSNGHGGPDAGLRGNRLSSKREAREAFFSKNEAMAAPKFDPSLLRERERDKEREKEKLAHHGSGGGGGGGGGGGTAHPPAPGSKEIEGYVGFANMPNQVYRKSVKRGFEFTLMVVGESGLGKSTLINSMFLTDLYSAEYPGPSHRIKKTVNVETTQTVLKEGGVQLRLTVVDTPGFGDAVDNSNCWQPIIDFIESKYDEYLNAESRVNRKTMPDNRVHCCLYFISPNGHGLKPLDVEFMKRLHDKVNIIPLISKADTLTPDECREFKKTILNEIAQHKIKIYEFPDADDEEENKLQKKLKDRVPFAVVGSNTVVESQGRKVRGRTYPWGIVEVENLEHNDFIALRNMLIRTYLQDLKDVTNNVHYENFRYNKLASVTSGGKNKNTSGKRAPSPGPVPAARRSRTERSGSPRLKQKLSLPHTTSVGPLQPVITNVPNGYPPVKPALPDSLRAVLRSPGQRASNKSLDENANRVEAPRAPPRARHRSLTNLHKAHLMEPHLSEIDHLRTTWYSLMYSPEKNPLIMMEDERREHVAKMKKMEAEMEQVFEMKVKEKKQKLKDSEIDLQRRAEQMKKSLEQQQKELDEKRRAFEKERAVWEEQQRSLEEQRRRSLENAKDNSKKDKKKSLF